MGQLSCQEIIYTSSESGIFNGNAGFGVRTCTRGMDSTDVDRIVEACAPGYQVYDERILDMDRILADPHVVYDYPPAYFFRTVDMNDGSRRYVFGRTVYLGVDYGFFKGVNAYDRTGTNYLTYLMVFYEEPPIALIHSLFTEPKYLPFDYSCYPDNAELQAMLTGKPEFLEEKIVEADLTPDLNDMEIDSSFIKGVVQMLKNRQMPQETEIPRKMYVKCPWKSVEAYLNALAVFPQSSLDSLHYISNYMQGNGIPDGYDMAFVNEYNVVELYEDNYITVDFFSGMNKNICNNLFLDKIAALAERGDAASAAKLIAFYLELKDVPETEYELYYNVFLGAVSDLDVCLSDMSEATIKKLNGIHLEGEQDTRYWGKINKAVEEGLISAKGSDFLLTVDRIRLFDLYCPGKVHVPEEYVSYLTGILFSGRGNFGKIADEKNISTLLKLTNRNLIPGEDMFLSSLCESSNANVWAESLVFYYEGIYGERTLAAIFNSSMQDSAIGDVIARLFPLSRYADVLFDYFKNHTADAVKAERTLSSLVRYYGENRFSDYVWLGQLEPEFIKVSAPVIEEHFRKRVETDVKSGVSELLGFIDNVGHEQVEALNLGGVLKTAAQMYLHEPLIDIRSFISEIEKLGIGNDGPLDDEMELLFCLSGQKVPRHVTADYLEATLRTYPDDARYLERLFAAWLRSGIGSGELKTFVIENRSNLDDASVEALVKSIWNSSSAGSAEEKEDEVLAVIDNCGWGQKKVEEFSTRCGNRELEAFLLKSNNIFGKTARRVLNFLKK